MRDVFKAFLLRDIPGAPNHTGWPSAQLRGDFVRRAGGYLAALRALLHRLTRKVFSCQLSKAIVNSEFVIESQCTTKHHVRIVIAPIQFRNGETDRALADFTD
jgi:hypothetical protein